MQIYTAFGLKIFSPELRLLELPLTKESCFDVKIIIQNKNSLIEGNKFTAGFFEGSYQKFTFNPDTKIQFCIENGETITIRKFDKSISEDTLRLYILGTCMGILLQQRNILSLHASGLVKEKQTFLLTGDSGVGKSTSLHYFSNKGYKVIGDDVLPILKGKKLQVIPAYPHSKLWEQTIEELRIDKTLISRRIRPELKKYGVLLNHQFYNKKIIPQFVIWLDWHEETSIKFERVNQDKAFFIYRQNIYRREALISKESQKLLLDYASFLAQELPLYRFKRPKKKGQIISHYESLEKYINQLLNSTPSIQSLTKK